MRSLLLEASCVCVMLALCLCSGAFMRFCYFDREFGVTLLRIALANGRRHSAWQGECKASWGNTFTGGGIPPRAGPAPPPARGARWPLRGGAHPARRAPRAPSVHGHLSSDL